MTIMSEGLPLNSKYIKMGLEKGGFQAFKELPLVVLAMSLTIMVFNHLRWSETGQGSLRISMITGITTAPPIKVLAQLLENYFILRNCFFFLLCGMNSQRCYPMQINTRI